eukprot:8203595-Karenia_brevis.AAC.1
MWCCENISHAGIPPSSFAGDSPSFRKPLRITLTEPHCRLHCKLSIYVYSTYVILYLAQNLFLYPVKRTEKRRMATLISMGISAES